MRLTGYHRKAKVKPTARLLAFIGPLRRVFKGPAPRTYGWRKLLKTKDKP